MAALSTSTVMQQDIKFVKNKTATIANLSPLL